MIHFHPPHVVIGGPSRFPQTPSTGPLSRTGGSVAGKRA